MSYLANEEGPVTLVMDLHIVHDRFGSTSDPSFNGHLHYPNDIDRSLNEDAVDKIRKYHVVYNNNPSSCVSFMNIIDSTFSSQFRAKVGNILTKAETLKITFLTKVETLKITLIIDDVPVGRSLRCSF